ncbi:MAG: transporter, partial [Glaciihabitans sp.]|nr:transporter [Glaciihabitans sp.]
MGTSLGSIEPGTPAYRRFAGALFLAGFATFIQVFSPQAFLPTVVSAERVSPAAAALLISGMSAGIAISVLPWASMADRIGHITAMKWSIAASSVLAIVSPLLPSFEMTVGGRIVGGLLLGAIPGVAMAYIAENISSR